MATPIKDLLKDLVPDDLLDDMLAIATAIGLNVKGWQTGSPIIAFLDIMSRLLALFWNTYIGPALRAQFLDYASGVWLTLVAWAVYGVLRRDATFATGSCKVENRGGNFYSFSAGDIRIKNASTGKTYVSTTGGTLSPWSGSGDYPTLSLVFQADEIGADSKAAVGEIEAYPNALALGPADVYAGDGGGGVSASDTNGEAFLAENEEGDPLLKVRCRASTGPLSPAGPQTAYEFIALSVRKDPSGNNVPLLPWSPGYERGIAVNISRVRAFDIGGGVLRVLLASPTGAATGNASTIGTDVWYAHTAIQLYVPPGGISVIVDAASERVCTYTDSVYVSRLANVTAAEAKAAVEDASAAWFSALPIGGNTLTPGGAGYVFASEVGAVASEALPGIFKVAVTGSDTAVAVFEVPVPNLTVNVTVVTQ